MFDILPMATAGILIQQGGTFILFLFLLIFFSGLFSAEHVKKMLIKRSVRNREHSTFSCLRRGRFLSLFTFISPFVLFCGKLHVFRLLITFVVLPKKQKNKVKNTRSIKTTADMKRKLWQLWCHVFCRRRI